MPYTLPDAWTWDMWFADDGTDHHVFYLKASRALHDPNRRHFHVTVGSTTFEGLPLVEQHRLVNRALAAPLADGSIHELRITTKGHE